MSVFLSLIACGFTPKMKKTRASFASAGFPMNFLQKLGKRWLT
ncbi:MAG: hypothetical protein ACOH2J_11845 [Allorhizobium sp.]